MHDFATAMTTVRWEAQNMLLWERRRESLNVRATCETTQEITRVGKPGRAADLNFLQWSGTRKASEARAARGIVVACHGVGHKTLPHYFTLALYGITDDWGECRRLESTAEGEFWFYGGEPRPALQSTEYSPNCVFLWQKRKIQVLPVDTGCPI